MHAHRRLANDKSGNIASIHERAKARLDLVNQALVPFGKGEYHLCFPTRFLQTKLRLSDLMAMFNSFLALFSSKRHQAIAPFRSPQFGRSLLPPQ